MIAVMIGVPWRDADGRQAVDRPEVRVDPLPPPRLPFEGSWDVLGAMESRMGGVHKNIQIDGAAKLKLASKATPHER